MASTHRHRKLDDNLSVYMEKPECCPVRVEVYMTSELADALVSAEMWRLDGLGDSPGFEAPQVALGDAVASALRQIAEGVAR